MYKGVAYSNLASHLVSRDRLQTLRSAFEEAGTKLSTGKMTSQELSRNGGSFAAYSLEREIGTRETIARAMVSGRFEFESLQGSLQSIRTTAHDLALATTSKIGQVSSNELIRSAAGSEEAFLSIASTLSRSVNGKALFSGSALDSPAIPDPSAILLTVQSLVNGAPDAASAITAVEFYFLDPAGGFATTDYGGNVSNAPSVELADGTSVARDVRADDVAIRELLKDVSLMAVASTSSTLSARDNATMIEFASSSLLSGNENIVQLQQGVGAKQELIENASVENSSQLNALEIQLSELVAVDLATEASNFEALRGQLEASYEVFGRLSSLNLISFLR